jgi:hypothetical protein
MRNSILIKFYLVLILAFGINSKSILAQDFYKGEPWLFSYNVNFVIEDAQQFRVYFNAEKIKWNFSPFNFTAEKRLKNGFGMTFMIGSNVYPEGQQISGLTIDEPLDLFNTEVGVKYNFNYLIKEDNKFDPYGIVTGGIWVKADKLLPTYGIGFGFNHWFSNYIGMTSNFQYKILKDFEDNKPDDGLVQIGFGLVHIVN